MQIRYEEAPEWVIALLEKVRERYFPELRNAKIKLLFDTKKRRSGAQMVLGRIMKTNDLLRHLTKNEVEAMEGCDYIITLDKLCWDNISDTDRTRILRHELRHTYVDLDSVNNPYKLQNHSILDFYEEVDLNKDDPRWRERVASLVESIYEQQKDGEVGRATIKRRAGS
jgi:hypothetical protein